MRRPLCLFCAGALGVELVCAFLPQATLMLPLAAFFVACLLWTLMHKNPARWGGVCLLLGSILGLAFTLHNRAGLAAVQGAYDGRTVTLVAEVESTSASYYPGVVNAVLRVQSADGEAADFRVECAALPRCSAGEIVKGRFALEAPDTARQRSLYADGIALTAELEGEKSTLHHLGRSTSFRARTAQWQGRLSFALRRRISSDPAGVLAAMVTGDRTHLSTPLKKAYRAAGLSHVLVVSGMHVAILCGGIWERWQPKQKKKKLRSYASCRRNALLRAGMAVLLVGVTGFTPSVLRAEVAVWVSALGVWVYGPADALTSLGIAGVLMTAANSYAICDIGFELSFAAVVGTLAGAELARRGREQYAAQKGKKKAAPKRSGWMLWLTKKGRQLGGSVWETLCVSGCAGLATFPVLVLRGMSTSIYALVSSVAVLWLVEPILVLGLAAALLGLFPVLAPLHAVVSSCAELLVSLLDHWALWVAGWPGAQLYFDTAYAALVCLLLTGLCWLAFHWRVRLRVALPALVLVAGVAIGAGNALSRDTIRVELVGSRVAPAVVLTQNDRAVVLYRGGETTRNAVENTLEKRGIRTVEALIDLRLDPQSEVGLAAAQSLAAASLPANTARHLKTETAALEILRTKNGCAVRVTAAGHTFLTLSGTVQFARPLQVEWLLASASRPGKKVEYQSLLTRSTHYRWMEDGKPYIEQDSFTFRP